MVETGGNQAYIFGSNRLRENLGASELVRQVCTDWADDAMDGIHGDQKIVATSGRAIVFFPNEERARRFVFEVTRRALCDAPGLAVGGAVVPWTAGDRFPEVVGDLSARCEAAAAANPPALRFPGAPILATCDSTGLPAEDIASVGGKIRPLSAVASAKRRAARAAEKRLQDAFGLDRLGIAEMEEGVRGESRGDATPRLAIVHADGNRIGQAFIALAGKSTDDPDIQMSAYEALSAGLEKATAGAVQDAIKAVHSDEGSDDTRTLLVPLVVAGDDLTFLCDARLALDLAVTLLRSFEERTTPVLKEICQTFGRQDLPERFSMGAGIALVKPHYPFHLSYALAEDLATGAKAAARAAAGSDLSRMASTLDVHLVSDGATMTVDSIRARRSSIDGTISLRGGPYVVSLKAPGQAYAGLRPSEDLSQAIALLNEEVDGHRVLSASKVNRARWALFGGRDVTDVPDDLIGRRAGADGSESVVLLDALELADYWSTPGDDEVGP